MNITPVSSRHAATLDTHVLQGTAAHLAGEARVGRVHSCGKVADLGINGVL